MSVGDRVLPELPEGTGRRHGSPGSLEDLGQLEDPDGLVQADREELVLGVDRAEVAALHHVRPVPAVVGPDLLTVVRVDAEYARQGEESLGVLHGDVLEAHGGEEARHPGLLHLGWRRVGGAPLDVRAVAPVLREHRQAVEFTDGLVALGQ